MARFVRVSALSPFPLDVTPNQGPADIVRAMKEHWQRQLDLVLPDEPDLIVLPEMCDRPTLHSAERRQAYYRERGDQLLVFFAEAARKNGCYIAYSALAVHPDGTNRNRTVMLDRKGGVAGTYDKQFPTVAEMESGTLCGNETALVACDFGDVALAICYDLVFDELRSAYAALEPDLIVHSSLGHFGLHANYWALSCRAHYVGAVARVGGAVINPLGDLVESSSRYSTSLTRTINLDCRVVQRFRAKDQLERTRELKQEYGSRIRIEYPLAGELGSYLLFSETEEFGVDDVIREFELDTLDDLLAGTRGKREECLVG